MYYIGIPYAGAHAACHISARRIQDEKHPRPPKFAQNYVLQTNRVFCPALGHLFLGVVLH